MKGYVHKGLLRLDPSQEQSQFTVWANPKSGEPGDWIEVEVTQTGACSMKSLEELAEIGHEAFTKVMGYTGHAWASLSDRTKAAKIAQTLAIIHEVLGAVTEKEAAYFKMHSEEKAVHSRFMQSRLAHYTRTASPEIPKEAIEAGIVAFNEAYKNCLPSDSEVVGAILTAALPHLKGGE